MICPCGSGSALADCCHRHHAGAPAATPEALMRSRYTAYVLKRTDYLLASWHPETRPVHLGLDDEPSPRWMGLTIIRAETTDAVGLVEFIARYKINGRAHRLHETSRFERIDGRWFYRNGVLQDDQRK